MAYAHIDLSLQDVCDVRTKINPTQLPFFFFGFKFMFL